MLWVHDAPKTHGGLPIRSYWGGGVKSPQRYSGLGQENIRRHLDANGIDATTYYDPQTYDTTLWPSENISQVCAQHGTQTTREFRATVARWRAMVDTSTPNSKQL